MLKNWDIELSKEQKESIKACKSPNKEDIFNSLNIAPDKVKILILGQDPYPKNAHGYAFSCKKGKKISLTNIFRGICNDFKKDFKKEKYDISSWEKKGILLLNSSLVHISTSKKDIKRQREIWAPFIEKVINKILNNKKLVVFLWGENAKKTFDNIVPPEKRDNILVLETSHPSNFSLNLGFRENAHKHFMECDKSLREKIWEEIAAEL